VEKYRDRNRRDSLTWTSRIMREYYVRFCERLGLKCPCLLGEAGITDINIARLVQISELFGVTPASFFDSSEETGSELNRQKELVNELQAKLINCLEGKMCCKEQ
jgi:hypothetical protein